MGVLLLEVALTGFGLGALMFGFGLLAIRLATLGVTASVTQFEEPQPVKDLAVASL